MQGPFHLANQTHDTNGDTTIQFQFQCSIFFLIFVFLNIFWSPLASFHWENETHTTKLGLRALFAAFFGTSES